MKITFCLPQPGNNPIGGYKVVYEYANRMAALGNKITIVYDCNRLFHKDKSDFIRLLKIFIKYNRNKSWFKLNNKIKLKYALHGIKNEDFPEADYVVATAIETVEKIMDLKKSKGEKIYFIQDIENWRVGDDYVNSTYAQPFHKKIVISNWIKKRVDKYSVNGPAIVINNGLDFKKLGVVNEIEYRNPYTVSVLYHALEHKGSKYAIAALIKLKRDIPELKVEMFGAPERPLDLPEWIHYTRRASAEQVKNIYNSTAIFLSSTINEGFGLTGAESMACGCALVSTNYEGVKEYAEDGENAILCPVRDAESLYLAMKDLMVNGEKRIRIAKTGYKDVQKLNWNESVNKFIEVLKDKG